MPRIYVMASLIGKGSKRTLGTKEASIQYARFLKRDQAMHFSDL